MRGGARVVVPEQFDLAGGDWFAGSYPAIPFRYRASARSSSARAPASFSEKRTSAFGVCASPVARDVVGGGSHGQAIGGEERLGAAALPT